MSGLALGFTVYVTLTLACAVYAYRASRGATAYMTGGQRLGPWTSAVSAGASDMSGWLFMALPGLAYSAGVGCVWMVIGLLAGTLGNWVLVARRLNAWAGQSERAPTLPEYLASRFPEQAPLLRPVASAFISIFFVIYVSAGLVACSKVFAAVLPLSYHQCLVIGVLAVLSYTLVGGFLAVALADLFQGLFMAAVLLFLPFWFADTLKAVATIHPTVWNPFAGAGGEAVSAITIASMVGWGFGHFGQPHILARFKAVRRPEDFPQAIRIATGWTALCLVCAMLVGIIGSGTFTLAGGSHLADPEQVFIRLVSHSFSPFLAGILLTAVLSAVMSTVDSQLLVAGSTLAHDLAPAAVLRKVGTLGAARLAVVLVGGLAYLIARNPDSRVLDLVAYGWAGLGATLGPVVLLSLYWRGISGPGAIAGVVVGGGIALVWRHLPGPLAEVYEIVPAFLGAVLAIFVISRLTRQTAEA